jgi:hypothetical protein
VVNNGGHGVALYHGVIQNTGLVTSGTIVNGSYTAGVYVRSGTLVNDGTIKGNTADGTFGTSVQFAYEAPQFGFGEAELVIGSGAVFDGAIAGLASGDVINVTDFAATSDSFVRGTGLILGNGTTTETLDITGNFTTAGFSLTSYGGNTTIALGTSVSDPTFTISGYVDQAVALGQGGNYPTTLVITNTGTVVGIEGNSPSPAISADDLDLVINSGLVVGTNGAGVNISLSTLVNDGTIVGAMANGTFGTAVQFGNGTAELIIGSSVVFDGAIVGFNSLVNDSISLTSFVATSYSYVSGTGLVLSNAAASETLDITGNFSTSNFTVEQVAGGTLIDLPEPAPCFCTGTRIATSRGNMEVERLQIGDLIKTATRGFQPIRWIGHQANDGQFIADNHLTLPIKIRRHALGFNVPSRDLYVSPDHALCEGGVLVQARLLINGMSITQVATVKRIEYFHIALEHHEVIFAENTPTESFWDANCARRFDNAVDAPADLPKASCLPLVLDGYYLARLKARIDARAGIPAAPAPAGSLRGNIDEAGPVLSGWAQDMELPEVPVELELIYEGRILRRFLANRYRSDLRSAGLGSGCHAFELSIPPFASAFTVRRVADGAILGTGQQ